MPEKFVNVVNNEFFSKNNMDTFGSTYAKAIDDLAGKIFISALICSLMVEFGSTIQNKLGLGFFSTYVVVCLLGAVAASWIMLVIFYAAIPVMSAGAQFHSKIPWHFA